MDALITPHVSAKSAPAWSGPTWRTKVFQHSLNVSKDMGPAQENRLGFQLLESFPGQTGW